MARFDDLIMCAGLNRSQRKFYKMPTKKSIRLLAPAGSGYRNRVLLHKY